MGYLNFRLVFNPVYVLKLRYKGLHNKIKHFLNLKAVRIKLKSASKRLILK